ncbi:hypothetical protein HDV05_005610 [Chytridiales sp. JEL 0842]|nr:hypothetical protein HDV05_005610 [Chytridiales sp. JEL 0842]
MLAVRFGHHYMDASGADDAFLRHLGNQAYRVAYRGRLTDPYHNISAAPGMNVGSAYYLNESANKKRELERRQASSSSSSSSSTTQTDPLASIWAMFDKARKIGDSVNTASFGKKQIPSRSAPAEEEKPAKFKPPSLKKSAVQSQTPSHTVVEGMPLSSNDATTFSREKSPIGTRNQSSLKVIDSQYQPGTNLPSNQGDKRIRDSGKPEERASKKSRHIDAEAVVQRRYSKDVFPLVKVQIDPLWHAQGAILSKAQYKGFAKEVTDAVVKAANDRKLLEDAQVTILVREYVDKIFKEKYQNQKQ